jgi:DNA-binding transcriptional regulator GbsR (MarR family)
VKSAQRRKEATAAVARTRDDEAVRGFIERFASTLIDAGFPRMPARVFVALLVTDSGRLTATELADLLHVSPAAVSGAVRYLAPLGLVSRERARGSRRDHYRVHEDVWFQTIAQRDRVLAQWTSRLREGAEVLGHDSPAGARMAETIEFFEFLERELAEMLERWRAYRAAR